MCVPAPAALCTWIEPPPRDKRGHAPQRRLLLSQPGQLGALLGVRDRRGHQLRERGQPRLGFGGSSSWWLNATTMQPHSRFSALTGTATEERSPQSREATWPITPETSL